MLKKAKSEATLGLKKISKSKKEKGKEEKSISHSDEAAKVYFTNVLQTEKRFMKNDTSADQSKPETEFNISLTGMCNEYLSGISNSLFALSKRKWFILSFVHILQ